MTDIWRSFVAQRIAWSNDWAVLFHEPNGSQQRNQHDLLRDLTDEIPGYLNNAAINKELAKLELAAGEDKLAGNLHVCYQKLIEMGIIPSRELDLLEAWIADVCALLETAVAAGSGEL